MGSSSRTTGETSTNMKLTTIIFALFAVAVVGVVAPAPLPYKYIEAVPYKYFGTNFQAVENQDEMGTTFGSYRGKRPNYRVRRELEYSHTGGVKKPHIEQAVM